MNSTPCIFRFLPVTLAALAIGTFSTAVMAVTVTDPEVVIGKDAIDPVSGPDAGSVNITLVAPGAPPKAALLAVPGMRVLQSFNGFEGAVKSPINSVRFTDSSMPEITFSINANKGYGGCQAAAAFTSGQPGSESPGESIYIGDNVNETIYTIAFSKPVTAAAFTMGREGLTSGVTAAWTATFYGPGSKMLAQQTALPGQGEKVAVLFGHIAAPGATIERVVFGKTSPETIFVMGNNKIFLDDVAFAPFLPSEPPAGVVKAPVLTRFLDPSVGESIDVPAQGAAPKSFLEGLPDFGVVAGWAGFRGKAQGDAPGRNYLEHLIG